MSMTITKRLSVDNYDRPEKTITETIQNKKDIEEQLVNFEEVIDEELCYVNINTQLKYLTYDKTKKKELFRFGGLLVKVNKDYIHIDLFSGFKAFSMATKSLAIAPSLFINIHNFSSIVVLPYLFGKAVGSFSNHFI